MAEGWSGRGEEVLEVRSGVKEKLSELGFLLLAAVIVPLFIICYLLLLPIRLIISPGDVIGEIRATFESFLPSQIEVPERISYFLAMVECLFAERIEGLTGWRSWRVIYRSQWGEPVLQSTHHPVPWEGFGLGADKFPLEGQSGIYSFAKEEYLREHDFPITEFSYVIGTVEALGPTIEAERGYQSEEARIESLALPLCSDCGKRWSDNLVAGADGFGKFFCASCFGYRRLQGADGERCWTAEEVRKLWGRRYGCEVLPVPPWVMRESVVGKVGGKYLVVAGESESQS